MTAATVGVVVTGILFTREDYKDKKAVKRLSKNCSSNDPKITELQHKLKKYNEVQKTNLEKAKADKKAAISSFKEKNIETEKEIKEILNKYKYKLDLKNTC